MKKLFTLICLFASHFVNAQFYVQGDLSVNIEVFYYHDSTQCMSFGNTTYLINVQNSFLGDTVKIIDAFGGVLISTEVNLTGQNPWILNVPCFACPSMAPDYLASQGVSFDGGPKKFISGPDTIPFAFSSQVFTVPNPCSYGNLSGRVYIDNNNDCVYNTGDGTLQSFYDLDVNANYNGNFFDFYNYQNNSNGMYGIDVQTSYLIDGQLTYSTGMLPFAYPNSCTPGVYNFDVNSPFPLSNLDFALSCTSNIDVGVFSMVAGPVRPAIPFFFYPHAYNVGCDTVSGTMQVILDHRVTLNLGLSSLPPTTVSGDTLTWNFGPLSNLSTSGFWNSLTSGLHLTPDSTVNIGDTLCFQVSSSIPTMDTNPSNNVYTSCYPVVNSYDPNIKEVMPKGIGAEGFIPPSTNELTYTIHFQNTGNAPAINVAIIDTIDVNLIPESIEILGRSHTMTPEWIAPGVIKFKFNNINLPDSFSNEPASHGFVSFKAKLTPNLNLGTTIENTAYIYFDLNAPIVTNTSLNTIDFITATSIKTVNNNLIVHPNPAKNELFINMTNFKSKSFSYLEIFSISGQMVWEQGITQNTTKVDISNLNKGLYFLKTNVDGQVSTVKFIKE